MPQDDPYAKIATADPYAAIAKADDPPPQGLLAKMASNWESNTTPKPSDGTLGTAIHNIGGRAAQGVVAPFVHPLDTLGSAFKVGLDNGVTGNAQDNPLVQRGKELSDEWHKDKALALENVAGDVAGAGLGAGLGGAAGALMRTGPVSGALSSAGDALQERGGSLVDRAVGSLQKDFKRGAEPGLSYLQGGGKPAMTMRGLSAKAGDVAASAGAAIRPLIASSNHVIPAENIFDAATGPVSNLRQAQSGFGGIGVSPQVDAFENHILPELQRAGDKGGYTPLEVYDRMKRPMQERTNWKDSTQFDLNTARQQTTGALGGLIADAVPEVKPLNDIFRGSNNLANRAQLRAETGSIPLSSWGRRAIEGGIGHAVLGPGGAAVSALDSVPGLTGAGYGLFKAGQVLPSLSRSPSIFTGPAIAAAVSPRKKAEKN